jgi:hypothetical protein
MTIKIQQKYERISDRWFPSQLNTELIANEVKVGSRPIKYVHRSYITEQQINPELKKEDFSQLSLIFDAQANKRNEDFWSMRRIDSLSIKERNTYAFYDSMPARTLATLNAFVKVSESLLAGKFRFKSLYIPVASLLRINRYEDYRFGIGLETSESISKTFTLDGFVGYGVKDKASKYGGGIQLHLFRPKDIWLKFSYAQDLEEAATSQFLTTRSALSGGETLRNLLAERMDSVERFKLQFNYRPGQFLTTSLYAMKEERNPTYEYRFADASMFDSRQAGVIIKYAKGERFTQLRNTRVLTGYDFPVIQLHVAHIDIDNNVLQSANKFELKVDHQQLVRGLGKLSLQFHAGMLTASMPYSYLFNGKGSNTGSAGLNNLLIPNHFQTMGIYEFVSDRFVNVMMTHNFGRLVSTNSKYFRPELTIAQHSGFGELVHDHSDETLTLQSYNRGYFESGLLLGNILRFKYLDVAYLGLGAGAFYRYGHYRLPSARDNMVWKFSLTFSF